MSKVKIRILICLLQVMKKFCFLLFLLSAVNKTFAVELVIGEERVKPGIVFIFEGTVASNLDLAFGLDSNPGK